MVPVNVCSQDPWLWRNPNQFSVKKTEIYMFMVLVFDNGISVFWFYLFWNKDHNYCLILSDKFTGSCRLVVKQRTAVLGRLLVPRFEFHRLLLWVAEQDPLPNNAPQVFHTDSHCSWRNGINAAESFSLKCTKLQGQIHTTVLIFLLLILIFLLHWS